MRARLAAAVVLGIAAFAALPATGAEAANTAKEVRIPIPGDDGTLTPYTFTDRYPLVTLIYDTLLWRDEGGSPELWLARSLKKGDAGKRITIRLRKDLRWHDGKPLTAEDVAFTFGFFAERFHPRFTPQLEAVERAEALDDRTVEITLRHASPGFSDQPLSDLPILPRHLWENLPPDKLAPDGLPVGSGPYRLVEHRRGKRYRFKANRGYFLGRPKVGTITVPFIPSFDDTVRGLENRRIDAIPVTLPEPTQDRLRRSVFETSFGSLFTGTVLMFNLRRPPFDDPAARRAVANAIDLRRLTRIELIGGGDATPASRGYLHPASGWVPPGGGRRFEGDRARSELAALDLPRIEVLAPTNDIVRLETGRQVVLALERAGAEAALKELPADRLAAAVGQDSSTPDFDATIWSSPPLASEDPDYLRSVFGSGAAPLNYSGYASARFDDLAVRTARERDPKKRAEAVVSQIKLLTKDAPVVPLFFQEGAFAYRPQIYEGWTYVRGTGILDKRSFLRGSIKPSERGTGAIVREGGGGGIGPLGAIALAMLGIVLLFLGVGFVARLVRR